VAPIRGIPQPGDWPSRYALPDSYRLSPIPNRAPRPGPHMSFDSPSSAPSASFQQESALARATYPPPFFPFPLSVNADDPLSQAAWKGMLWPSRSLPASIRQCCRPRVPSRHLTFCETSSCGAPLCLERDHLSHATMDLRVGQSTVVTRADLRQRWSPPGGPPRPRRPGEYDRRT
jgi:hypothetical protein